MTVSENQRQPSKERLESRHTCGLPQQTLILTFKGSTKIIGLFSSYSFDLWALLSIHISAVLIWIGAHVFEFTILKFSLGKVSMRTKAELFLPYQARFARITGLASSTTMYTGVLLASFVGLGSFSYVFTTPWGLLATAYFISVMINQSHVLRLKHDSPISTAFLIFGTVTLLATAVVVVAYASLPTNLTVFEHSNWGLAVLASGLLAIFISRFGLLFGTVRTQLTQLAPKILSGDDGDKEGTSGKQFNLLQRRLQLTMIPETIIIFIVVALMVYSGSPF